MHRTSAAPITVDGTAFECWHVGIMQTEWRAVVTEGKASVGSYSHRNTYWASVNGKMLGSRFRLRHNAMKAVAKAFSARSKKGGA